MSRRSSRERQNWIFDIIHHVEHDHDMQSRWWQKKFNLLDPKLYPFYILHHSFLSFVRILTTCSYSKKTEVQKCQDYSRKNITILKMTFGKRFLLLNMTFKFFWTNENIFSLKFRENDTFATKVERIIFFSFFFVSNCNFN